MPVQNTYTVETSLLPTPAAPPDTPRTYAMLAPATPAGVTAKATAYSTLAEMEDDGWGTGYVAYNAMSRLLEQTPTSSAVSSVVVIRRETPVANVWTVDIVSTADGDHKLYIGGVLAATFAASSNTNTEIKDGLVAAFNLGPFASEVTAASIDTDSLSLTAAVAGIPFTPTAEVPSGTVHVVTEATPNVGAYDDLAAAFALLPFWGLLMPGALAVELDEGRRWVQADTQTRRCFLFAETSDVGVYDNADTDNLAVLWATAKHPRVNLLSHPIATDYMQSAAVGRLGGAFPGSRAWHYVALAGSTESDITANRTSGEVQTMQARFVSRTERYFGPLSELLLLAEKPNIPSGHFVYQRHAEDWWWYTIRATIDGVLKAPAGVNLDDAGLQGVVDAVKVAMIPLVNAGVIAADFTVTYTALADVPAGELAIGDFKTTGRILASATITPKLRALKARAEFSLV